MLSAGKRSRPKSSTKEEKSDKPRRKRQKIERKSTVELETIPETSAVIDRKTTSFLEKMKESGYDVMSQLSEKNRSILVRRLSSIIGQNEPESPKDINLCQVCGMNDEIAISDIEATSPLLRLPVTIWEKIFLYLSNEDDVKSLRESYSRMEFIFQSFVSQDEPFVIGTNSIINQQENNLERICSNNYTDLSKTWDKPWIPYALAPKGARCQPKGLSVKLYSYQARALSWMLQVERIVRNEQTFIFSSLMRVPGANIVYDTNGSYQDTGRFMKDSPSLYECEEYQNSFTTHGGIFADEMGLGKTISMISLILSNPREQQNGEFVPAPRGSSNPEKVPKVETKATLVICPNHLVTQWASEITSRTSLTVVTALTIVQHRKLTYSSFVDADVVIYGAKFLAHNSSYYEVRDYPNAHTCPLVSNVGWHRIIIDEGHEVLALNSLEIEKYRSNYRWYVTGTPIPNGGQSLATAMAFLNCNPLYNTNNEVPISAIFLASQAVKRTLYWRNTKHSVGAQIEIPNMVESIELITLSSIERAFYDNINFSSSDNKDNQRRNFIAKFSVPLTHTYASRVYDQIAADIKRALVDIKNLRETNANDACIKAHERRLIDRIASAVCFERALTLNDPDVCDSCEEESFSCTKLPCAHYICPTCISKITSQNVCPKCKTDIIFNSFKVHEYTPEETDDGAEEPFTKLRIRYRSKFARIARYLSDVMEREENSKLIVFSKYDSVLCQLKQKLENSDLEIFENKFVRCKGNVHCRNKQLERFKKTGKDAPQIFLLSSKSSAAGTHLAVATHVLLLDPAQGTAGDARATDAQAIARAHRIGQDSTVIVVRFVVANTIDQDDYESVYGPLMNRELGPKSARK